MKWNYVVQEGFHDEKKVPESDEPDFHQKKSFLPLLSSYVPAIPQVSIVKNGREIMFIDQLSKGWLEVWSALPGSP